MEQENKSIIDQLPYNIQHIYNGLIRSNNNLYPMIEFKVIAKTQGQNYVFSKVNFKCGWFLVDSKLHRLVGPLRLDLDKIKGGVRVIKDTEFDFINEKTIESIDNDPDNLIDNIPKWMLDDLIRSIDKEISISDNIRTSNVFN